MVCSTIRTSCRANAQAQPRRMQSQLLPREDHSPGVLSWSNRLNARDAPHGCVQTIADRKWHKHLTPHQKNERSQCVRMRATGSTSTRGSEAEGKTILAETWLMEIERRMRFLVIENSMTRNVIQVSTFSGHPRCNSIPSCWVSMLRGVRFWASLYILSELAARGSTRQR